MDVPMVAIETARVKILGQNAPIMCEVQNCGSRAQYLFRVGGGKITAHCGAHAGQEARRLGIGLPSGLERRQTWLEPEESES